MPSTQAPIGVFNSGVGGLSVLRPLRQQLPAESFVFFADQAHVPYGPRPLEEVRRFSVGITRFLIEQGARLIVVACNTASAAALQHLRDSFPGIRFVGMEPAVKPAAEQSRTRAVGVLATPATFQGALFASVVERFAQGVSVLPQTLPGLVERIEAGDLDGPQARAYRRGRRAAAGGAGRRHAGAGLHSLPLRDTADRGRCRAGCARDRSVAGHRAASGAAAGRGRVDGEHQVRRGPPRSCRAGMRRGWQAWRSA